MQIKRKIIELVKIIVNDDGEKEMKLKWYTDTNVLIDNRLKSNVEYAYARIINYTCNVIKFDRCYFPKFNYVIVPIDDVNVPDGLILIKLAVKYNALVCCSIIINNNDYDTNHIDYEFCSKRIIRGLLYFDKLKLKCELVKK